MISSTQIWDIHAVGFQQFNNNNHDGDKDRDNRQDTAREAKVENSVDRDKKTNEFQ